jgi:hypothetical protein
MLEEKGFAVWAWWAIHFFQPHERPKPPVPQSMYSARCIVPVLLGRMAHKVIA